MTPRIRWYAPLAAVVVGTGLGFMSVLGEGPGRPRALVIVANLAAPWAMGAFLVGTVAKSPKRGAILGGLSLLVGMAVFLVVEPSIYVRSAKEVVWTIVALSLGPALGLAGGSLASSEPRFQVGASIAPSTILLAETLWTVKDRRAWLWNLQLEPQRIADLVILLLMAGAAFLLPVFLVRERRWLPWAYVVLGIGGTVGAVGFALLYWLLLQV